MPIVSCIDDFYEEVAAFNKCPTKLVNGQLAWVPTLIPKPLPWVMDVERSDPRNHDEVKYKIRTLQNNDFKYKKDRLPIHRIDLHPTEELFAIKAKKRPCIMISQYLLGDITIEQLNTLTGGKAHLLQQEQIFIPIYSTEDDGSSSGFPQGFVKKIRQLAYPHLLYVPDTSSSKKHPRFNEHFKEGIARLDRIFSSIPHHAQITPTNVKLSDEFLAILMEFISEYLLGKNSEELDTLKELCQSES